MTTAGAIGTAAGLVLLLGVAGMSALCAWLYWRGK
jgi:hypothetical protein